MVTSQAIKQRAREIGFDLCGIAPAAAFPELSYLRDWIDRGYAGTMAYLPRTAARRADVRHVVPAARSVIVLGTIYNTGAPYSTERVGSARAEIARYATSADYHDALTHRMDLLLDWMRCSHPDPFDARAYVDTGPVQERVYAQYAGLGWIGKNSCVINPGAGSWFLISEIITSLSLEIDAPALDQCGTCTLCLEACPTQAFVAPHQLDATRCISYLTIEYRGVIPQEYHEPIGNHVFGCDVCQEVCPWNSAPATTRDPFWSSRPDLTDRTIEEFSQETDERLGAAIAGTPLTRAGVKGLRRNLSIAQKNRQ